MLRRGHDRRKGWDPHAAHRSPVDMLVDIASQPLLLPPAEPFRLGGDAENDRVVAGYRVLRLLGRGSRANVYLGRLPTWVERPAEEGGARATPAAGVLSVGGAYGDALGRGATSRDGSGGDGVDPPPEVALKVFHPGTDAGGIDREIAALTAAASPHVVRLLDVARTGDSPICLVLARHEGDSLPALLEARGRIRPGEAVTVLAPILEALTRTHRAGYTHGSLRMPSVLFDAAGAPVIIGWGHTTVLLDDRGRPPGPERLAATPAVTADLRRFAELVGGVLDRVEGGDGGLAAAVRRVVAQPDVDAERRLTDALFDLAEPLPVALAPRTLVPRLSPPAFPSAALRSAGDGREPTDDSGVFAGTGGRSAGGDRSAGRHREARRRSGVEAGRGIGARVLPELRRVRRPVWLAATAALVALLAATLVLSPGKHGGGPIADEAGPALPSAAPPEPGPPGRAPSASDGTGPDEDDSQNAAGKGTVKAPAVDELALRAEIAGDDPVAAGLALLRLRAECLRARSESCLEGVDQPGSVALAADLAELRSRPADVPAVAPPTPPTGDVPLAGMTLVERFGGTAIVAVPPALLGQATPDTPPASLLLIRSEAGWRIRDVL